MYYVILDRRCFFPVFAFCCLFIPIIKESHICPKYYKILSESYEQGENVFADELELEQYLSTNNFTAVYAVKKIKEALLIGAIVERGFDTNTVIHSDGARQFNLFVHSLCWKHAERPLVKLKCYNPVQEQSWNQKMTAFWQLYQELKKYKEHPNEQQAQELSNQFDVMCEPVAYFSGLNKVLAAIKSKKKELLVVLHRPQTSLHNNDSERDIREYAKRRKISAGTRSENGRKARDTFLSLKKTCRKLGISFWEYLTDRLQNLNHIPPLSLIMQQKHDQNEGVVCLLKT